MATFYEAGNPIAPDFLKKHNFASEALTEPHNLFKMTAIVDLGGVETILKLKRPGS